MSGIARRQLIKTGAISLLGAPVFYGPYSHSGNTELTENNIRHFRVDNALASPVISSGDYLMIDNFQVNYSGDGIYLYPDWGKPQVYHVQKLETGNLLFTYPGQAQTLWQISEHQESVRFAGKAIGHLPVNNFPAKTQLISEYSALVVPTFPTA